MSEITPERLYQLLPAIYRQRDAAQGEPLRALMTIIGQEMQAIEADIDGLYEDWFIETCDTWVIPYLADLLGIQALRDEKDSVTSQRARVANAIRYRRRKGTTAALEHMVRDATGWYGRVIEFFEYLGTTQQLYHLRPDKGKTLDLGDLQAIETLDGPFEAVAHTIDVRSKYNIANVGLFLWRLQSYRVTRSPAYPISGQEGCYTFHPLGYDMPLFNRPQTDTAIRGHTEETQLPVYIRPRALTDDLAYYRHRHQATPPEHRPPTSSYYGRDRSIAIWREATTPTDEGVKPLMQLKPPMEVVSQDLQHWSRPPAGKVAIDVKRGRLAFAAGETPSRVEVSYNYGFSADIGGGPYDRYQTLATADSATWTSELIKRGPTATLQAALRQWNQTSHQKGIIHIGDNGVYGGNVPAIELQHGTNLVIQANDGLRPSLRPLGRLRIQAPTDGQATLTLNGLYIEGTIEIEGNVSLTLQHCTLMPPPHRSTTTLEATTAATNLAVTISHSIIGPIRLPADCLGLTVADSIIDGLLQGMALAGDDQGAYGPRTTLERTTVLGQTVVKELPLASNVIFTAPVQVQRQQNGHIRYSFVPYGSRTPQRYRCQPDLALERLAQKQPDPAHAKQARAEHARAEEQARIAQAQAEHALVEQQTRVAQARAEYQVRVVQQAQAEHALAEQQTRVEQAQAQQARAVQQAQVAQTQVAQARFAQVRAEEQVRIAQALGLPQMKDMQAQAEQQVQVAQTQVAQALIAQTQAEQQVQVAQTQVAQAWAAQQSLITQARVTQARAEEQARIAQAQAEQQALAAQPQTDIIQVLVPRFTSIQYGNPGYGQLHVNCPKPIRTGAEDDAEMGVFNQLKQTYREAHLGPILAEYLPLGLRAEIFYVT